MDQDTNFFLIRLASSMDENALLEIIEPLQAPAFFWPADMFRAELVQTKTWILEQNGKPLAFVCVRDVSEAYEISVLATGVSQQGKGVMRRLLQQVIEELGGKRHLWLEVHENNLNARKLYEKLGFVHTGTRGGYYRDGSAALLYTRFHS